MDEIDKFDKFIKLCLEKYRHDYGIQQPNISSKEYAKFLCSCFISVSTTYKHVIPLKAECLYHKHERQNEFLRDLEEGYYCTTCETDVFKSCCKCTRCIIVYMIVHSLNKLDQYDRLEAICSVNCIELMLLVIKCYVGPEIIIRLLEINIEFTKSVLYNVLTTDEQYLIEDMREPIEYACERNDVELLNLLLPLHWKGYSLNKGMEIAYTKNYKEIVTRILLFYEMLDVVTYAILKGSWPIISIILSEKHVDVVTYTILKGSWPKKHADVENIIRWSIQQDNVDFVEKLMPFLNKKIRAYNFVCLTGNKEIISILLKNCSFFERVKYEIKSRF